MADKYDTYSDVEDDVEIRCEDSYSPTDGLFGNCQHPRDTFVQSPTAIVHAKHTEANKAGLSEGSPQQQPLETVYEYQRFAPTSPARTRTNVNDRTPLLHDAPPPAYSGPQNVACPTIAWAEERGAVATHSPLFPARLPQSMCGLIRVPDDEPERDSYKYPRIWSRFKVTCKWVLEILCGILVVLLVLLILLEALMGSKMKDISKNALPGFTHQAPPIAGPASHSFFKFFQPSRFTFEEEISGDEFRGGVYGCARVVKAPSFQTAPIEVAISLALSEPYPVKNSNFERTDHSLKLLTPPLNHEGGSPSNRPSIWVGVTIAVKPGARISSLLLDTRHIDISLEPELDLSTTHTLLKSKIGSINSEAINFSSRITYLGTDSGSVRGHHNLYDILSVSSMTGFIDIDVSPKAADKNKVRPAELKVYTHTGNVDVHEPSRGAADARLPDREYKTTISSHNGSISGNVIHGSSTTIESKAGTISVDILPYSADDSASTLSTKSLTAMTQLRLLSPHRDPGTAIRRLQSSHIGNTGTLQLKYPQEWVGKINGETATGLLSLAGQDVVVDNWWKVPVGTKLAAHKGEGDLTGTLNVHAAIGSVEVVVGDVRETGYGRAKKRR